MKGEDRFIEIIDTLSKKRRKTTSKMMYSFYSGQIDMAYNLRMLIKRRLIFITKSELDDYILEFV